MRTWLAVVAVLVVAVAGGTLVAARWGGASSHDGTDLTITLAWPAIAPHRTTTHLDCSSVALPAGSRLASVCRDLSAGRGADLLPPVASGRCLLAPLEIRSASVAGWIRGRSVRFALSGCDEPAISGWFGAVGSFAPKPVRPSSPWCPGQPLDPGMPPGVWAPVIVPPRATVPSRSPDAVLAATMRGMAGGLITTAKLHPAGKANHYTRHDSLLELAPRPGSNSVSPPAEGEALSRQWQASWEEEVLQGALWERLCETANGPVVGSADVVNGVVTAGAFAEPPDIAYGQVFDAEPTDAIVARIRSQLQAFGLVPLQVVVVRPLGAAPLVVAEAPDPRAFARQVDRVTRTITGRLEFDLYEGVYLEVRDPSGSIMLMTQSAPRRGEGGGLRRPDVPGWQTSKLVEAVFYVPSGSRRFIDLPTTITVGGAGRLLVSGRWRAGSGSAGALSGTAQLVACSGCRPVPVRVTARTSPAGCGAFAITGLTIVDPAGRRRTYRVGSAPDCLAG